MNWPPQCLAPKRGPRDIQALEAGGNPEDRQARRAEEMRKGNSQDRSMCSGMKTDSSPHAPGRLGK